MVGNHTDALHKGVADGRADECESALFHIGRHGIGFSGVRMIIFQTPRRADDRFAAGEAPDVLCKAVFLRAAKFFLDFQEAFGVLYRRGDFQTISDNARVFHEARAVARAEFRDFRRIEIAKRLREIVALVKYALPRKSCLIRIEHDSLEYLDVVLLRPAPYGVVVDLHARIVADPRTTDSFLVSVFFRHRKMYRVFCIEYHV